MTPEEGGRKKPCTKDMQLMCFSKTWDCAAYVTLEGKEMAMPGEDATMFLKFVKPMVMEEGQNFTLRDSTGTIGTGQEAHLEDHAIKLIFPGRVTGIEANMNDEDKKVLMMNKEKRAKYLAKKAEAAAAAS